MFWNHKASKEASEQVAKMAELGAFEQAIQSQVPFILFTPAGMVCGRSNAAKRWKQGQKKARRRSCGLCLLQGSGRNRGPLLNHSFRLLGC